MLIGRKTIRYHPFFQPLVDRANALFEEEAKEVQFIQSVINSSCSVVLLGVDHEGNYYYLFPYESSYLFIHHKPQRSYYTTPPSSLLQGYEEKRVGLNDLRGT